MTAARRDGCPRCLTRDHEPTSWDESTGKATYRCECGWVWSTCWEHPAAGEQPDRLGEVLADLGIPSTSDPVQ